MDASDAWHFKSVSYTGQADGARLIVLGAVHGNETCGSRAIGQVMAQLDSGALRIKAGCVTFVPVANPLAYANGTRAGQRNLNRALFPKPQPHDFEDRVANWLCPLLARHQVLLDLHSFKARGAPFAMLGPRNNSGPLQPFAHEEQERALARHLGVRRFVDGWLATHEQGVRRRMGTADAGALQQQVRYGMGSSEYMRASGGYGLTLECGQHADPGAPEVACRAILNSLAFLGLSGAAAPAPVAATGMETFSLTAVHDKLAAQDAFCRDWASFDAVHQGDEIGKRADGSAVLAEFDGRILFPDSQADAGSAWYYLASANPLFDTNLP